jgi:putative membrane protein
MCAIFGIIFLGAIVALVVWALFRVFPDLRRRASGTFSRVQQGDPAEEILHQRFARGEINAEEYQQALRLLKR